MKIGHENCDTYHGQCSNPTAMKKKYFVAIDSKCVLLKIKEK